MSRITKKSLLAFLRRGAPRLLFKHSVKMPLRASIFTCDIIKATYNLSGILSLPAAFCKFDAVQQTYKVYLNFVIKKSKQS